MEPDFSDWEIYWARVEARHASHRAMRAAMREHRQETRKPRFAPRNIRNRFFRRAPKHAGFLTLSLSE